MDSSRYKYDEGEPSPTKDFTKVQQTRWVMGGTANLRMINRL
jgi:hypothetical protein